MIKKIIFAMVLIGILSYVGVLKINTARAKEIAKTGVAKAKTASALYVPKAKKFLNKGAQTLVTKTSAN